MPENKHRCNTYFGHLERKSNVLLCLGGATLLHSLSNAKRHSYYEIKFELLRAVLSRVEREKQSIAEQLQQLEVSIREHEVQMKQQEAKNRSLQEAYDEEQKKVGLANVGQPKYMASNQESIVG